MALRAFQCNPSLGGFGSESGIALATSRNKISSLENPAKTSTSGGRSNNKNTKADNKNTEDHDEDHSMVLGKNPTATNDGCDAFAQIVKELVDNAVDACGSRGASSRFHHSKNTTMMMAEAILDKTVELKRVRVTIDRVKHDIAATGDGDGVGVDGEGSSHTATRDILRVTVSDNGIGMQNIEQSVSAFCTSKAGSIADNESSQPIQKQQCDNLSTEKFTSRSQGDSNGTTCSKEHTHTAGRYGIGLTLCLLHAQRLVPNSCASITSATSSASVWTRAHFVVDTDRDRIICIKKESVEKKKKKKEEESGTAVSLLLPGGKEAKSAWPRLAEYFARFQLSLGIECSLQVRAPSLSRVPLFIRPPFEVERRRLQREKRGKATKVLRRENMKRRKERKERLQSVPEHKGNQYCTDARKNQIDSTHLLPKDNKGDEFWKGGLLDFELKESEDEDNVQHKETNESNESIETDATSDEDDSFWNTNINNNEWEPEKSQEPESPDEDPVLEALDMKPSSSNTTTGRKKKTITELKGEQKMASRRMMMTAASAYLNKNLELKNIAHSIQPIRRESSLEKNISKAYTPSSATLAVYMIVHGPNDDDGDAGHDYDCLERSEQPNDEEKEISGGPLKPVGWSPNNDNCKAKIMLVRMVNRIPLLDSAEAFACGLVRGITRKQSMWNSFGLEAVAATESNSRGEVGHHRHADSSTTEKMEKALSSDLFIPMFLLSDSAQVAPFFDHNRNHSLFQEDVDTDSEEDENTVSDVECDPMGYSSKRKRAKKKLPLPAGLRLGNILVIVQLYAKPSELPLPTLSKGRLPMNDKAMDEALEVGLLACLRSIQSTNPLLLLTTTQLKRTERDVKYLPAVASALASLVSNCNNLERQRTMNRKMINWTNTMRSSRNAYSVSAPENDRYSLEKFHLSGESYPSEMGKLSSSKVDLEVQEEYQRKLIENAAGLIEFRFRHGMSLREEQRLERDKIRKTKPKKGGNKNDCKKRKSNYERKVVQQDCTILSDDSDNDLDVFLPKFESAQGSVRKIECDTSENKSRKDSEVNLYNLENMDGMQSQKSLSVSLEHEIIYSSSESEINSEKESQGYPMLNLENLDNEYTETSTHVRQPAEVININEVSQRGRDIGNNQEHFEADEWW